MHMGQLGACSASTPHFDAVTCKMDNVFGACALPIGPRRRTVGIGSGSCSLKRLRPGLGSLWLLWLPRRKHGSIHPLLPAHASLHPWPPWGRQGVHAHRDMFSHDFAAWRQPRPRPERPLDLHQPPASKSLVEPRITLVADSCAAASPWQVLIRWQRQLCVGSRCCASLLPPPCHPAGPFRTSPPLPPSTIFGFGIERRGENRRITDGGGGNQGDVGKDLKRYRAARAFSWRGLATMIQKRRTYTTVAPVHSGIKMAVMNPERKAVPPLKLHAIKPGGPREIAGEDRGAGGAGGVEFYAHSRESGGLECGVAVEGSEGWADSLQRAGSGGHVHKQQHPHVPNPPAQRDVSPRGQAHWSMLPGETLQVGGDMALMGVDAPTGSANRKIKSAWQHPAR